VPVLPFDVHARAGGHIDLHRLGIGLHSFSIAYRRAEPAWVAVQTT
jgi:hypothetical protein